MFRDLINIYRRATRLRPELDPAQFLPNTIQQKHSLFETQVNRWNVEPLMITIFRFLAVSLVCAGVSRPVKKLKKLQFLID